MIKVFLITVIILILALAGLGIKMLVQRNGQFSGGGTCRSVSPELNDQGISCACGHEKECENQ